MTVTKNVRGKGGRDFNASFFLPVLLSKQKKKKKKIYSTNTTSVNYKSVNEKIGLVSIFSIRQLYQQCCFFHTKAKR